MLNIVKKYIYAICCSILVFCIPIQAQALTFEGRQGDRVIYSSISSSSKFDGAGSLIKPTIACWGCDRDEAKMHPHSSQSSTVVFQWIQESSKCPYLKIEGPSNFKATVSSKEWATTSNTSYITTLPVTISNSGTYTTTSVTSMSPVSNSTSIIARCSTTDEYKSNRQSTSAIDTTFSNGYTWMGNGSIISKDTGTCTDFGCTKDWAIGSRGKKALTAFQWQVSSECRKLRIQVNGGGRFSGRLKYKGWNLSSWEYDRSVTFPRDISKTSGYYVFSIETSSGAIPSGKYIEAICLQ